jgi:hypothetical protein
MVSVVIDAEVEEIGILARKMDDMGTVYLHITRRLVPDWGINDAHAGKIGGVGSGGRCHPDRGCGGPHHKG